MNKAEDQLKQLADFLMKYYPGEIKDESAIELAIRLLSPTTGGVNDSRNPRVPNWAVDTLAKKEVRKLSQYLLENHERSLRKDGTVVDIAIGLLQTAYQNV